MAEVKRTPRPRGIRRVETPVTLDEAKTCIEVFRILHGPGPWKASMLAPAIWPTAVFRNAQGAGAAASRVLKRLGYRWTSTRDGQWGWLI